MMAGLSLFGLSACATEVADVNAIKDSAENISESEYAKIKVKDDDTTTVYYVDVPEKATKMEVFDSDGEKIVESVQTPDETYTKSTKEESKNASDDQWVSSKIGSEDTVEHSGKELLDKFSPSQFDVTPYENSVGRKDEVEGQKAYRYDPQDDRHSVTLWLDEDKKNIIKVKNNDPNGKEVIVEDVDNTVSEKKVTAPQK